MLEKLSKLKKQKVEVHLTDGDKMRCIPQQYLEEDYESYLVDVYESYGSFAKGMLVELMEDEIKEVILL